MASITNATLHIHHDHGKDTARPHVTCTVNFTGTELCLMRACPEQNMFKLRCQLWGADSGLTGADDYLYTYGHAGQNFSRSNVRSTPESGHP